MSHSKYIQILVAIGCVSVVVAGYFHFVRRADTTPGVSSSLTSFFGLSSAKEEESAREIALSQWQSEDQDPSRTGASAGFDAYVHPELPFSFGYPKGMTYSEFKDETGAEILLFQGGGDAFQVSIRLFDEPGPLTVARIRHDIPDLYIEEPQIALIGPGKEVSAFIFFSQDSAAGKTREVWYVHGGYLYQISAHDTFDPILARIMGTWKFFE